MPHDARDVANFFIERALNQKFALSHLGLQKILFFGHAWHLGKYKEPLIGQKFEAWKYGPVVRAVYDQLKFCEPQSIREKLKRINVETGEFESFLPILSAERMKFLENIFDYYAGFDPSTLVDLTHQADSPWKKVWAKGDEGAVVGMYIPDDSIRLWILSEGGASHLIRH